MFPFARRAAALAALLAAAACADYSTPAGPSVDHPPDAAAGLESQSAGTTPLQARNEVLARRFALALRDDGFRAMVVRALRNSREAEGKVYLQGFLSADRGAVRHRLAELSGDPDSVIAAELSQSPQIEIYLPVPEHRMRWRGDLSILVATAERDGDAPVAFDSRGRRHLLDPDRPPAVPVIALGRAETRFADPGLAFSDCIGCFDDPGGTGGGLPGAAPPSVTPGLYMTYARYTETFEGI